MPSHQRARPGRSAKLLSVSPPAPGTHVPTERFLVPLGAASECWLDQKNQTQLRPLAESFLPVAVCSNPRRNRAAELKPPAYTGLPVARRHKSKWICPMVSQSTPSGTQSKPPPDSPQRYCSPAWRFSDLENSSPAL